DYFMPQQFGLKYVNAEGQDKTPVMLHRAVLGSLERFFAVYIEHVAGHFPVWLAPEQVAIVSVSEAVEEYAKDAAAYLKSRGVRVVSDLSNDKLGAKIRNARNTRVPYIAVVGQKEADSRSLALRRGNDDLGAIALDEVAERMLNEGRLPRP
ncbi:MAG: His/Gly/Thr/Pro-type tRNA ligase C-terminal domain-containing protein, partial [Polyangiales bacterium]